MAVVELDNDILRDRVRVQEHGDEGGWQVEEAVSEVGEEDELCLREGGPS